MPKSQKNQFQDDREVGIQIHQKTKKQGKAPDAWE
jgi:hypothetical protein